MKKKLKLRLKFTPNTISFCRELQEKYFALGTPARKDFQLIVYPDAFEINLVDTPQNRSAFSCVGHKNGVCPAQPLTKFDEYMILFNHGKHEEARDAICNDALKYVQEKFGLALRQEQVTQVFCNKNIWQMLSEKWGSDHFNDKISANLVPNFTYNPENGSFNPKDGHNLILINAQSLENMSYEDQVLNYALDVFHEFVHISGIKDEQEMVAIEARFSKEVLGIYPQNVP